jgi:hypothetical protein
VEELVEIQVQELLEVQVVVHTLIYQLINQVKEF